MSAGAERAKSAMKRRLTDSLDYERPGSDGSNHNTELFSELCIDGTNHSVGKTGKKAKRKAAKRARVLEEDKENMLLFGSSASASQAMSISPAPDSAESPQNIHMSTNDSIVFSDSLTSTKPQFRYIKPLGNGQFGEVILVKDTLLKIDYAVKIVPVKENALEEARALSKLLHPNIVRYYSCWIQDSNSEDIIDRSSSGSSSSPSESPLKLYIQMEFCDSGTLKDWIETINENNLGSSERIKQSQLLIKQIVSGLEHIHSKKFFHRDLKPTNILVTKDGTVKIGDFGLVTIIADISGENQMERSQGAGTPSYMAPEQTSNNYDHKVDMFPVGLMWVECLWRCSTGHERVVIWPGLRENKFPDGFKNEFFDQYMIIQLLLCENPEKRPGASELRSMLKPREDIEYSSCPQLGE